MVECKNCMCKDLLKRIVELEKKINSMSGGKPAKKATKAKRKPSAYNLHVKKEMKSGLSMAEAAKSWKAKK